MNRYSKVDPTVLGLKTEEGCCTPAILRSDTMMSRIPTRKIKVIQFLGYGAPSNKGKKRSVGGAEIFTYELVKKMGREKYRHLILYAGDSPMKEEFKNEGLEVIDFKLRSKFDIQGIVRLARMLKLKRVDIINSHATRYDFAGALVSIMTGIPLVITRHVAISDYLLPKIKKAIYTIVDWFSIIIAEYIIAISIDCRNKILKSYCVNKKKIRTIYCGVDFKKYKNKNTNLELLYSQFDLNRNIFIMGTVAQLRYYKGIDILINAIPHVVAKFPNSIFLIVGEGPERSTLENLCEDLNVKQYVRFLGFRKDVFRVMQLFDMFILTSRREGLPLVIIEAMYARKPVVATSVGAVSEVVKAGVTGELVDSIDSKRVACTITTLFANQRKMEEYGQYGHNLVVGNFSIQKASSSYAALYDLIGKRQ